MTLPLFKLDCHLIDSSSIIAFSGADYVDPNRFVSYRAKIWAHLESLILAGKLKTVSQVLPELKYNDITSYRRLMPFKKQLILTRDKITNNAALTLIAKYPDVVNKNQHYTRTPADPYLIVYAKKIGASIITDELQAARRISRKSRLGMPDICDAENISWCSIEDFLKIEEVIP